MDYINLYKVYIIPNSLVQALIWVRPSDCRIPSSLPPASDNLDPTVDLGAVIGA